jgi:TolB-like protein
VLPFSNLGNADEAYFADGMTEEITARLAKVAGLRVISRTSAATYAGSDATVAEIGKALNVQYVLEGSVRWTGGPEAGSSRIRITPQLIRVADDSHLWAETYDRTLDDVFRVQSEIAQAVVDSLGVTLLPVERTGSRPCTDSVDAYQAYSGATTRSGRTTPTTTRARDGRVRTGGGVDFDSLRRGLLARVTRWPIPATTVGRAPGVRGGSRRSSPRAGA